MLSSRRRPYKIAGLTVVLLVSFGSGCKGFFVNAPATVTVTPTSPTLTSGQPQSFKAQAAFSDSNSTKDVTALATWTTSDPCVVQVISTGTNAGNATDVGSGAAVTVTATYAGVIGTATVTPPTGLTISPCPQQTVGTSPQVVFKVNQTGVIFTASGATGPVTWTSDNGAVVFASASSGAATFPTAGQATITATSNPTTGTLFVTVQQ